MDTAILVIDLQNGLFNEEGKPFDFQNVIERINKITSYARKNNLPVIFIQHEQENGVLQFKSSGWSLVPELHTEETDLYVRKTTPNSFLRTNLNDLLIKNNIKRLIVCGYASEFCVDSTIRGGAELGYSILIASDAHTTHEKQHASAELIRNHHNETLSNISGFGVPIMAVKTEELIKNG